MASYRRCRKMMHICICFLNKTPISQYGEEEEEEEELGVKEIL